MIVTGFLRGVDHNIGRTETLSPFLANSIDISSEQRLYLITL